MLKIDLDKRIERVRSKFHESEGLPEDDAIKAAYLEVAYENPGGLSDDAFHARVKKRSLEKMRESESLSLPRTPTDRILADAIIRALAPRVTKLRVAGFGDGSAPFSTAAKAVAWIEDEDAKARAWFRARGEAIDAALEEIYRLAYQNGLEIEDRATFLVYQVEGDGHTKDAATVPGSYAHRLAQETRRIAKHTGLPQDAFTIHVLTGLKPERGRVRITTRSSWYTLPSGEQINTNDATVTFRARDLNDRELRRIYNFIRGGTGGKGAKGLTERDEYLWKLVQDAGGPPSKHGEKGRFWRRIRDELKAAYPEAPSTANGIEQNYGRILRVYRSPRTT